MTTDITYDKETDLFTIVLTVPKTMRGEYTYGDGEWIQDAVCVYIDENLQEFCLSHTQYLDYKGSLQATQPIIYFNEQKEAEDFAEEHDLMIEYAPSRL